jgi:putative transposase
MARPKREWVEDGIYHAFSRGSNKRAVFYDDDDRRDLLLCLERVLQRHGIECLAYALMPNHCHYLLRLSDGGLSPAMRELNGRYALRFNRRHGLAAHLFQNRFGAVLQKTTEQLLWTARYVVMNPVTAGLCRHPDEWFWSSYRATARIDPCPSFLSAASLLSYFSDMPERALEMYVDHVAERDTAVLIPAGV